MSAKLHGDSYRGTDEDRLRTDCDVRRTCSNARAGCASLVVQKRSNRTSNHLEGGHFSRCNRVNQVNPMTETLRLRLSDGTGVYVNDGVDETTYFADLAESIRENECDPYLISAVVTAPGFPHLSVGEQIDGYCLARSNGYWLVYRPQDDLFYAFWGKSEDSLGAPGVSGSPLYCWSA